MLGFNWRQKNQTNSNFFSDKKDNQPIDKIWQKENEQSQPIDKKRVDLNRYKDPEGLTLKNLEFGLWLSEHRKKIIFSLTVILIVLSAIFWGYALFGLGYYFIVGAKYDNNLIKTLVDQPGINHQIVMSQAAKQPVVEFVKTIRQNKGKYDFAAKIKNPNDNYWLDFEYYFSVNGNKIGHGSGFVMPGESQYFFSLNQEVEKGLFGKGVFHFENINFFRINKHIYPNWKQFRDNRFNVKISNKQFTPARFSPLTEKVGLNILKFNATNNTAYNYWEIDFKILLLRSGDIAAVNQIKMEKFFSRETRAINVTWPGDLGQIDDIQIIPEINIINPNSYIKMSE